MKIYIQIYIYMYVCMYLCINSIHVQYHLRCLGCVPSHVSPATSCQHALHTFRHVASSLLHICGFCDQSGCAKNCTWSRKRNAHLQMQSLRVCSGIRARKIRCWYRWRTLQQYTAAPSMAGSVGVLQWALKLLLPAKLSLPGSLVKESVR